MTLKSSPQKKETSKLNGDRRTLKTSSSPRDEDKNFSFIRKNYIKQEKRTGKGGDLCGFNLRIN